MSSLKQIEANRLNAQHSTGPPSPEGKAAVRFNALKTGIHAQSQVIPGEDPAALALLIAEYYDRYQPATPEVRALVDTLITAEWLQRRFRTLEAQIWRYTFEGLYTPVKGLELAQICDPGCEDFNRLQRRIDAADRTYHRTLLALQKIESRAPAPQPPAPGPASEASLPQPPAPGPASEASLPRPPAPGPASEASLPRPPAPGPRPRERSEPEIGFVPSIPAPPAGPVPSAPGPVPSAPGPVPLAPGPVPSASGPVPLAPGPRPLAPPIGLFTPSYEPTPHQSVANPHKNP